MPSLPGRRRRAPVVCFSRAQNGGSKSRIGNGGCVCNGGRVANRLPERVCGMRITAMKQT